MVYDIFLRKLISIVKTLLSRANALVLRIMYPQLRSAFSVSSHLTISERVQLMLLSKRAKHIAEIGSYIGASACCFGAAVKPAGSGKIVCIDTWNNDAMTEGNRDTWKEFQNNTRDYKSFILPVRGFSTDVIKAVSEVTEILDVLFIDGDHSYVGVKADWEAYKNFLKDGSTVIFHDYGWAEGVMKVVHEDVMPLVSSHGQLPNMWWGQMGKAA